MLLCIRVLQIIQTAYIFDMQYLKYIINAGADFHIRLLRVHDKARRFSVTHGEPEKLAVSGVLIRIVPVGQLPPKGTETENLSPFKFLQQRYVVEQFTVHIISQGERGVTVVQELHVIDQVECFLLGDV